MANEATIYDVAAHAGVSISTVSHTLNRPHRVNAETRRRVLEAIDELGYVPRATAVARARRSVGRVGVFAPFTSYASFNRRLLGVLKEAAGDAIEIVVYDQQSAAAATSPLLSSLPVTHRLDGFLIMGLPLDDTLTESLLSKRVPTVLVDSDRPEFDSVTIDDEAAGHLVARHLLQHGRRTIAYASEAQVSTAYVSQGQRRRAGVQRALVGAGLDQGSLQHVRTTNDMAGGRAAVREMLADGGLPDAVFAHQDLVAAGVLLECRDRGVRVPDDMAIVGFDDTELAAALDLTTVWQPLEESGRMGFRYLREGIDAPSVTPRHVTLGVQLVVRKTG